MTTNPRKSVIDFTSYITERTYNFIGREWVFQAINDWLTDTDGLRFFLLAGEPGSGKTAIASRLAQFSQGSVSPSKNLIHLAPHFLSAMHFCSARDSRWINPYVFSESLAIQLAVCYPAYAKALAEKSGDRQVRIEVQQHFEQGHAVGVIIHQLDVSGVAPEDAFNRVVREPLEALFRDGFDQQVVILVDALDEALGYSGNVNIVSLLAHVNELPPCVRFILTSRQDSQVEHAFLDAYTLSLSAAEFGQYNQEDIRRYVEDRLHNDKKLAKQVEQLGYGKIVEKALETIIRKAEGNFLYVRFLLDAIASDKRSLTELEGLPEGLDALYFESLQRVVNLRRGDWYNEYASLIGMLTVAQENPTFAQIQSYTKQSKTSILKHLDDLWQFIEEVKPLSEREIHYRLYHQSIIDFLHSESLSTKKRVLRNTFYLPANECHKALAEWCERGNLSSIWENTMPNSGEQGRREYARRHYITHLYYAEEWQHLFNVLDAGHYGRSKLNYDPSTRNLTKDLDIGRQAAAWEGYTLSEGIGLLPKLWRYTLLRCSLSSRADLYTEAGFQVLLLLKREAEALDLAELLTNQGYKSSILLKIAKHFMTLLDRKAESLQLFARIYELADTVEEYWSRDSTLRELAESLAQAQQWELAGVAAHSIKNSWSKAEALSKLAESLAQVQRWEQAEFLWREAEAVARSIEEESEKVQALSELAKTLAQVQRWEQAEFLWKEAENIVHSMEVSPNSIFSSSQSFEKAKALSKLAETLAQARHWEQARTLWKEAEVVAQSTNDSWTRATLLSDIAEALAQAQQWEQAEAIAYSIERKDQRTWALAGLAKALAQAQQWERAEVVARSIERDHWRTRALSELTKELAQAQQWEQAHALWKDVEVAVHSVAVHSSQDNYVKAKALSELAKALAQAQLWKQAHALWKEAEVVARVIEEGDEQAVALSELAKTLAQAQCWEQAAALWKEAEAAAHTIVVHSSHDDFVKSKALSKLVETLAQVQHWEQAVAVARSIKDNYRRAQALSELVEALAHAQQWEQAEAVARSIEDKDKRTKALSSLVKAHVEKQQWEQAVAIARSIESSGKQDETLRGLSKALAQAQHWEQAAAVAGFIDNSYLRAGALRDLSKELAEKQYWEQAVIVARSIKKDHERARALSDLAECLAQAQHLELVEVLWEQAVASALGTEDSYWRDSALSDLANALAQAQHWEQAMVVARSIKDNYQRVWALNLLARSLAQANYWKQARDLWKEAEEAARSNENLDWQRSSALNGLVEVLAQTQQWEQAEAIAHSIDDSSERVWALSTLAKELAKAEQWNQAEAVLAETEKIAQSMKNSYEQAQALRRLASGLAQARQWERSEKVARSIEDYEERDAALTSLVRVLTEVQQWEQARRVARSIEQSGKQAEVLSELMEVLVQAQQWEQAEKVAYSIKKDDKRAQALRNLADALMRSFGYEKLLDLVQRSCLQADKGGDAFELLALAHSFFSLNPEISVGFYESYFWVDRFLENRLT